MGAPDRFEVGSAGLFTEEERPGLGFVRCFVFLAPMLATKPFVPCRPDPANRVGTSQISCAANIEA